MHSTRLLPFALVLAMSTALFACETGTPRVDAGPAPDAALLQPDAGSRDAGAMADAGPPRECSAEGMGATIGETCFRDSECSDGCFCNGIELCRSGICEVGVEVCPDSGCATSTCDETNDRCDVVSDDTVCDDGQFCNGAEVCDGVFGCRPGAPPYCSDADFCTVDSCDEEMDQCAFEVRDEDGDGYAGALCGGVDCNDSNASISPDADEVCDNNIDDDCNGAIDLADLPCQPTNDTCSDTEGRGPEDITPVGNGTFTFVRTTLGLAEDVDPTCTLSSQTGPDAIFALTLTEPKDITLRVLGVGDDATIALRTLADCATDDDLRCNNPSSSSAIPTVARPNLSAGDYAIIVETENGPSTFTLEVTIADSAGVQNDFCGDDLLDISAGGNFAGTLVGGAVSDDMELDCRNTTLDYQEVMFALTVPAGETRDVTVQARTYNGDTGRRPWLAILSDCVEDSDGFEVACTESPVNGESAELIARGLPEGTYTIVLEADFTSDNRYEMDVTNVPAAAGSPGDLCSAGVPLSIEASPVDLDVSTLLDGPDEAPFCGANRAGYRDGFYTFNLTEERDVVVTTSGSVRHWAGISDTCGTMDLDRNCYYAPAGTQSQRYLRLAAGDHFLNVSTLAATGTITASIELFDPTPVPANNSCATAATIADGVTENPDMIAYEHTQILCGGDTDTFDAFYTFTLAVDRFVSIRADDADGVALLGDCASPPIECASGNPPRIERTLTAGTYTIAVLDSANRAGPVVLRFNTSDP